VAGSIAAPKGTKDILPTDVARWQYVESVARALFATYRYAEIRTPIFEPTDLFSRGIGEETDIVGKEMYSFTTRGDDKITLRPENTAGVVRAFIQHKLFTEPAPQKLWYTGPMFRYERPQAGRQRQFHQLGVECLGSDEPRWDAESIMLAWDLLEKLGLENLEVQLNSVGCPTCRPVYRDRLQTYLRAHQADLCENCVTRTEKNPLRVLDCKVPACAPTIAEAPPLADALCEVCRTHQAAVESLLNGVQVPFRINPRLVRGLDYYTRTVFEVVSGSLGAQNTVLAGGRYNHLVEELGGPATPSVGWALGMERLLMLLGEEAVPTERLFGLVAATTPNAEAKAFELIHWFRRAGHSMDMAPKGKLDKLFKQAERLNARFAFILGEDELASAQVTIKDLDSRNQVRIGLESGELEDWLHRLEGDMVHD
jgi:histidyl-tRNA synthetase